MEVITDNGFFQRLANLSPDESGKYGLDTCLEFINFVADTLKLWYSVREDGKVTMWEKFRLAFKIGDLVALLPKFNTLIKEIADIQGKERIEIVERLKNMEGFRGLTSQEAVSVIAVSLELFQFLLFTTQKTGELWELLKAH